MDTGLLLPFSCWELYYYKHRYTNISSRPCFLFFWGVYTQKWNCWIIWFSSVQVTQSCPTLWPHWLQHTRLPCPSSTPGAYSNSCPLSWWCHPTMSSSVTPFSFHLQYFPGSGSFQMSQFFIRGGQNIGISASASVLPVNISDWFPLGWTDWISLQSNRLSEVFSNTIVQKHSLVLIFLYSPTLTSIRDYWKNHSFD